MEKNAGKLWYVEGAQAVEFYNYGDIKYKMMDLVNRGNDNGDSIQQADNAVNIEELINGVDDEEVKSYMVSLFDCVNNVTRFRDNTQYLSRLICEAQEDAATIMTDMPNFRSQAIKIRNTISNCCRRSYVSASQQVSVAADLSKIYCHFHAQNLVPGSGEFQIHDRISRFGIGMVSSMNRLTVREDYDRDKLFPIIEDAVNEELRQGRYSVGIIVGGAMHIVHDMTDAAKSHVTTEFCDAMEKVFNISLIM